MQEEPLNDRFLVRFVEDHKGTGVLRFRSVVEVGNVFRDDLPVGDQEPLTVNHVRNHHDLVDGSIGELQWQLRRLDIKRQNHGICGRQSLVVANYLGDSMFRLDEIPFPRSNI